MMVSALAVLLTQILVALFQSNDALANSATFKVAVYDQSDWIWMPETNDDISREEALTLLMSQIDTYEKLVIQAASEGVVMIVFSEYGLMPNDLNRRRAYNFTEPIPDPHSAVYNPCGLNDDIAGIDVHRRLSCLASNHSMYITANIGERVTCDPESDVRCPADGRYQFNTNIVFDPSGVLVAKYRKYNLFMGEPSYDQPSTVDHAYFDTPYGRFGAIVCFDIIFDQPPVYLVENFNVSHVLFPTEWMNVRPYYSAVTFHQAFAIGMGVNLLGSNRHEPSLRMVGSGIYGSNQTYSFIHDELSLNSSLLISEIPVSPTRIQSRHPTNRPHTMTDQTDMRGPIFGDVYNFVTLTSPSGTVSVCHNTLCCMLNYTRETSADVFVLGAFKGLHTLEGQYYLEMCILLKCQVTPESPCDADSKNSSTRFPFFSMTGNFSTPYIYPMVVSDGIDPSSGDWEYTGEHIVSYGTKKPLISSTMYGRRFDLDEPDHQADNTTATGQPESTTAGNSSPPNPAVAVSYTLYCSALVLACSRVIL